MTVRHRPMQPSDVHTCVQLIASSPAARCRYGDALQYLEPAWLRLLGTESKSAVVFEEVTATRAAIGAIGVSVFVQDDFLRELKTRPFRLSAELARLLRAGSYPLLSERQIREANSRGGLNVLVWEGFVCPGHETNPVIYHQIPSVFVEEHRGYLWKEIVCHEIDSVERLRYSMQIGALYWDPLSQQYKDHLNKDAAEILKAPHLFGMTREIEADRLVSWMGILFDYEPPKFGLSRSEQRLLTAALDGATDQELGETLKTSLATVKKTWRSIYERVAACSPELIPNHSSNGTSERGKEKKQHLVAYMREHLEELRPHSRKLLRETFRPVK
jgi:DNA-binding NarL/FixJ family response regulator